MNKLKIVFWSPLPGQSGTTSSMLAAAVMSSLELKKSIFLMHGHFLDRSLEKSFLGKNTGPDMFEDIGIDSLMRNIKISELNEEIIHDSAISLYNNRVHILPGTTKGNRQQFTTDSSAALPAIINSVNKFYDLVFVDSVPGPSEVFQKIREEADLIVVTLTQNKNIIDDYFFKYHLPEEKTLYFIGRYNDRSCYNLANLERSYHSLKNRTAVIPYSVTFMDAVIDGKLMNYMVKNLVNCKGEEDQYFMRKVRKAVSLLFDGRLEAGEVL